MSFAASAASADSLDTTFAATPKSYAAKARKRAKKCRGTCDCSPLQRTLKTPNVLSAIEEPDFSDGDGGRLPHRGYYRYNLLQMTGRFLTLLCWLAAADSLAAADRCQAISDIAGQSAIAKPAVVAELRKNPQKGTLGEPWRHLWFVHYKDLKALGIPETEQQEMFKTIVALNFSKNPEVNYDIFRDYFFLRCKRKERGQSTVPLASIPAALLTQCWDTVSARPQFQACMEKLLGASDAPGDAKRKRSQ